MAEMSLYLLRHGQAGEKEKWTDDDRERPLTEAGREEMRAVAQGIVWLDLKLETLITSPLTRAKETADYVEQALHPPVYVSSELLAPGCDLQALGKLLEQYHGSRSVMIVGHEPDLSQLLGELISAKTPAQVQLKKAACCRIDLNSGKRSGKGMLIWHLPPKILARIGQ